MPNKTVKDFEFPASFGFTGSGGKTVVKGYTRKSKNDLTPRSNLPQYNAVEQKALSKRTVQSSSPTNPRGAPPNPAKDDAFEYSTLGYKDMKKGGAVRPAKVAKVMHEFKAGTLHSGSKKGPKVTSRKQAIAIAISEARGKKMAMGGPVLGGAVGNLKPLPGAMPSPTPGKDVIRGALGGLQRRPANLPAMIRSRMGARDKGGLRPAGVPPYSGTPMIGGMKKGGKVKC
jgi:hypothetical protein